MDASPQLEQRDAAWDAADELWFSMLVENLGPIDAARIIFLEIDEQSPYTH